MKIRILSDVHYDDGLNGNGTFDELYEGKFEPADINLLAGDIAVTPEDTEKFLNKYMPNQQCYIVGGNHIVYRPQNITLKEMIKQYKEKFPLDSCYYHFLENSYSFIPGTNDSVAVIGSIFYTDYMYCDYDLEQYNARQLSFNLWLKAYGFKDSHEDAKVLTKQMIKTENMLTSSGSLNDFKWGYWTKTRHLSPEDYLKLHKRAKKEVLKCYKEIMSINPNAKVILLTHHCLSPQCVHSTYKGRPMNASFVSDLERWITKNMPNVRLVVSGHVHNRFNFTFGKNRVKYIVNPVGYIPYKEHSKENPFNPNLIIDTKEL